MRSRCERAPTNSIPGQFPGETNSISVEMVLRPLVLTSEVVIRDAGAQVTPGNGCTKVDDNTVSCRHVTVVASTGDMDDTITLEPSRWSDGLPTRWGRGDALPELLRLSRARGGLPCAGGTPACLRCSPARAAGAPSDRPAQRGRGLRDLPRPWVPNGTRRSRILCSTTTGTPTLLRLEACCSSLRRCRLAPP